MMIYKKFAVVAALAAGVMCYSTAAVKVISDSGKQKQVKSMESIDWNFEPAIYYGWFHPKYSGAKNKFLGLDYSFHEDRSDTKRLMWIRSENTALEQWRTERMQAELDMLAPVVKEEAYQAADRLVDIHYTSYKDEFERLQDQIEQCLAYSIDRSRGKMREAVEEIIAHNKIVCDNIAYIRKTGPGAEMENASRQDGYEQALLDMRAVLAESIYLLRTTINLYPPK